MSPRSRGTGSRSSAYGVVALVGLLLLGGGGGVASAAGPAAGSACVEVASTSISPAVLRGGDGARQSVTLERPAPYPFQFVSFDGFDYVYGQIATGVRVPGGQRTVSFPVAVGNVAREVVYQGPTAFTAYSCNGQVAANPVTVLPLDPAVLAVRAVTTDRPTAAVGEVLTATLHLSGPARERGTTVRVLSGGSSSGGYGPYLDLVDPADPLAPAFVRTVPAGQTSVSFPVWVSGEGPPGRTSLTATMFTSAATAEVLAVPRGLSVRAVAGVSGASSFTVGLGRPAPAGGARVAVTVRHPDVHAPAFVTVPAGARGAVFPLRVEQYPDPRPGTIAVRWDGRSASAPFGFS